jgi:hypothetical protein
VTNTEVQKTIFRRSFFKKKSGSLEKKKILRGEDNDGGNGVAHTRTFPAGEYHRH